MADEKYEIGEDGLIRELVGDWVKDKHLRLRRYIDTSRFVRRKFLEGRSKTATYIDLFCGPGQCRVRETKEVLDGSPLVAFRVAKSGNLPFSEIHLGDMDGGLVDAACARIKSAGGSATGYKMPALEAAEAVVRNVNPHGLHFVLLDPYKLESLSFNLIKTLAGLKYVDMLLHVSAMDLTRNLDAYLASEVELDAFAPGWKGAVDHQQQGQEATRAAILNHWCNLVQGLGFSRPKFDVVTASGNQRLYWLAFISRKEIASTFWEEIRYIHGRPDLLSGLV